MERVGCSLHVYVGYVHFKGEICFSVTGNGNDVIVRGASCHVGDDDVNINGRQFVVFQPQATIGDGEAEPRHGGI